MNPIFLPVAELKPALIGLGKVIRKRPTLPVLGCMRVQNTSSHSVELTVTDLNFTVVATLPAPPYAGPGGDAAAVAALNALRQLTD